MHEPEALKPAVPDHTPVFPALTKIVATLGPSSSDPQVLGRLIEAGVSVFRLNFSHGSFADHEKSIDLVRSASRETGRPVAVLGDLQGPKIRVGAVIDDGFELTPG
ncbi:MAG: hypothetical protein KC983_00625, partial [Phycisphaerales bacterium]|nr:hypothetical protein [Phycisphaerales bacterium]